MSGMLKLSRYEENWMGRPPVVIHGATVPRAHVVHWEVFSLNAYNEQGQMDGKMDGCRVWLCNETMDKPTPILVVESADKVSELFDLAGKPEPKPDGHCPHGFGPNDKGCPEPDCPGPRR
jgi:hypothetical protein